jgi:hypothetical protein
VLFGLVYLLLRHIVRLIAGGSNEQMNTEVELVVLRHQLMVLKRQVGKPKLRRRIACSWPRSAGSFVVLGGRRSS